MNRAGGSTYLALLLCIPLILVPCESEFSSSNEDGSTGVGDPSLFLAEAAVSRSWTSCLSVAAIYAIAEVAGALAIPSRMAILRAMTNWLPPWAIFTSIPQGISAYTLWLACSSRASLLRSWRNCIIALFSCQGFGLRALAPVVNAALHSICHFYTPWNYLVFFLAFLPLAYYVRLRGNLLPTIITHILFNSVGVILVLAGGTLRGRP